MIKKIFNLLILLILPCVVLANSTEPTIIDNTHMKWIKMPHSVVSYAVLAGNPKKAEWFILRVKFPANYNGHVHHHLHHEYDTVISGTAYIAIGKSINKSKGIAVKAGQFVIIPPNVSHYGWMGNEETIIQISGMGPWNPLPN